MPTTPNLGLRYPALSSAPNVPLDIGNLAADVDATAARPVCYLVQQVAQTGWTSAATVPITWSSGSEVIDTLGIHDETTNNSRLVIGKRLGWWLISGVYCPASNGQATYVRAMITKNGSVIPGAWGGQVLTSATGYVGVTTGGHLVQATSATDYVELWGQQFASTGIIGTSISTMPVVSSVTAVWQGV
ncbi:hypothetical protein [Actinoplanes teichomyceticus]|uniref:Uncharacterized protein n=1 Tax=Actinoplanes teichomyceticus TaxID=1867 RepID=A0A561WAR3_ACTTI|nr:hypothetical protein [Actinoplanes teichomyceticus]TWG20956.1 hypothetical protein FHX34_103485 [Actinoplanes teichomyceticus]GIF16542.1 hypothetical protein Ate01nite_65740 [Actinoplanes teichomyceticus]